MGENNKNYTDSDERQDLCTVRYNLLPQEKLYSVINVRKVGEGIFERPGTSIYFRFSRRRRRQYFGAQLLYQTCNIRHLLVRHTWINNLAEKREEVNYQWNNETYEILELELTRNKLYEDE